MWCRPEHTTLRCAARSIKLNPSSCNRRSISAIANDRGIKPFDGKRLSQVWIPTGGVTVGDKKQGTLLSCQYQGFVSDYISDDATAFLVKAGFIRQVSTWTALDLSWLMLI
jgi:hypothetical protein